MRGAAPLHTRKLGLAGRFASIWIDSKLTPLFIIASLLVGTLAVVKLPREEEPQIIVPMIDLFVTLPGASAKEVEQRITKPMEKLLWEIPGVEYVYSTSSPGMAMAIVRFYVGQNEEDAVVRLNQKMYANFDLIPPGASPPLIKPRSIDDVPILALTLTSDRYNDYDLRRIAAQATDSIKQVEDVSAVAVIGGQRREVAVTLNPAKLDAFGLSPGAIAHALEGANQRLPSGKFNQQNREFILYTGDFLRDADEVRSLVVAASNGRPVYLGDVAEVTDTGEEPSQIVQFGSQRGFRPAVTIAISKRKSTNAIEVANNVLAKMETLKGITVPSDVEVNITRHYGETAEEKSDELLFHMLIAIVSVSIVVALTLGFRESLVVFSAIPVTLALTLTVFYLHGFTLNRITLFALIFSIGILVDDAIVVVENIVRHARLEVNEGRSLMEVAIEAVDEVGNPTILATLAVIAAILPLAFVGGLMGPYMLPIPIGASAAMVFSLIVAFLVTPWAAVRLLRGHTGAGEHEREDRFTRFYRRFMGTVLPSARNRHAFLGLVTLLLAGSMVLVYIGFVKVKMLPFDNKNEFQVVIDMPEGTSLEETARATRALADEVLRQQNVVDVQTYVGTAAPYNFNGLVRHYYLRQGSTVADIQVNLPPKHERSVQSHEIAKSIRTALVPVAEKFDANIKVAEVPPGPPVLQTLVAEVYGPTAEGRETVARQIRQLFDEAPGVVDIDWYIEDDQARVRLLPDSQKAALNGISEADIAHTISMASAGHAVGLLHDDKESEDVPIRVRLDRGSRSDLERLLAVRVASRTGTLVPLRELVTIKRDIEDKSIYHKNLMPVTYITADVAGVVESPVYAILGIGKKLESLTAPDGGKIEQHTAALPTSDTHYSVKWDGEWHITYEVFRDMGLAFAVVLLLIYILMVGWFQDFLTPVVIMAAIPFSLVGILPAHGLMHAFFTATSMIGFIAGAGIVVRNSIILVDFTELRLREGHSLRDAVIDAGAVRFRPMMLTAAALIAGAAVILFDPIFQGLAIALMAGEVASLLLSRMTIPITYYMLHRKKEEASV
ncbi:MAG: efflux RND transporter permease subunit [Bryobacterales bacterium]|nr:efflux RND transporter permease subunit [Bryobacterales bacterium]